MNSRLRALLTGFDPTLELERASTPPASWYLDEELSAHEAATVFSSSWQLVARADQLVQQGDYVTAEIAGEPIVVVRDASELRAFYNVCRHHAAQVAQGESGNAQALHCPYHGWTYNLDGSLRHAPLFDGACDFDHGAHGLPAVRVDTWRNWVFVCLDGAAEDLSAFLHAVDVRITPLQPEALEFHERVSYTLECNWKAFVDNYLDGGYHVPYLHRELNSTLDTREYRIEIGDSFCLQTCPTSSPATTAGAVRGGEMAWYFWLYPNLMINWYEGVMDVNLVLPLSAERCLVHFDYYFADQDAAFRRASINVAHRVQLEDVSICELVQRGLRSRSYEAGRLSPEKEGGERLFHRLLHQDLIEGLPG